MIKEVLYDPFGGIMEDSNPALRIPIGFAGGLHDPDLGFVRFGWRDYDTFTSRWTAPDPLGDEGGDPDWYGYCLDDPVNGNDPLGLKGDLRKLGKIASSAAIGAGMGAARGYAYANAPGAIAFGLVGLGSGAVQGAIKEYPPVKGAIDKTKKRIIHELTDGKAERMMKTRWKDYDPSYYIQTK